MSVVRRATGGAAWTVASGLVSRGIGMVGTLIMTHYLAPQVMGEVTTATVLAFTANWITQLGLTQYVMLRAEGARDKVFHATAMSLGLVAIALALVVSASPLLANWFNTPDLAAYLPGMAVAVFIRRVSAIPDKLLLRRMRFRTVALANALGEVTYVGVALVLVATTRLGGHSIVIANIIQAAATAGVLIVACGTREWLTPVRLRWRQFREILSFGVPMGVEAFLYEAARYGDKLVFTKLFGAGRTGEYNLAYNLADMPASQVGEQVSNVVLPTLLQFEGKRRKQVLVRAIGLLSFVTFPMAVGLGIVAPTLVEVLLPERWQGVAPLLLVLAMVSVFRPINGLISQYLISTEQVAVLMRLEIVRVVVLFGTMILLGQVGPIPAALSVGIASLVHMILLVGAVHVDGDVVRDLLRVLRAPIAGCIGMVVVVLLVRMQLEPLATHNLVLLGTEVMAGVLSYLASLYLLERAALRDVIDLARGLLQRTTA